MPSSYTYTIYSYSLQVHSWHHSRGSVHLSAHLVCNPSERPHDILGNAHVQIKAEFPQVETCDLQLEHPEKRSNLICHASE